MKNTHRTLGNFVVVGVLLYFVLILILHLLRPDSNPARHFLSEYAVGPFAVLGTIVFYVMALTVAALTLGLLLAVNRSTWLYASSFFLILVSVAFVTSAIFPTDVSNPKGGAPIAHTQSGAIHDLAGLFVFLGLVIASLTLPWALKRDAIWRASFNRALLLGLLILGLFFAFFALPWAWKGLGQRAMVFVVLIWLLTNGLQLRRHTIASSDSNHIGNGP